MSAHSSLPLRLADVAIAVSGTVVGDPETLLRSVAALDRAGASDLSFCASPKYAPLLLESAAGGVLISPELVALPGRCANRVVVANPYDSMLALLPHFYRMPERPFVGVHPTAVVAADAKLDPDICIEAFVVIGPGVRIGKGAWIGPHCVISEGVSVGERTQLHSHVSLYAGAAVGDRCILHSGVRVGSDGFGFVFRDGAHQKIPHVGKAIIGNDVEIGANSAVDRGSIDSTVIGDGTKIDNLVHVGHNVRVGRLCLFAAGVGIAGSTRIEDGVMLAGQVGVAGHLTIGARAVVTAQSGVLKSIPPGQTWGGFPSRPQKEVLRGYASIGKLPDLIRRLERLLSREPDA